MKSVYIFGPIHLFGEDYIPFYERVREMAQKYFDKVVCTYPDYWDTKDTPAQFYKRTYDDITDLDLFVGEVSSPSWGVGMELQMAQEHKIPCIVVHKDDTQPSTMVRGLPTLKQTITYKDIDDVLNKLEVAFKGLQNES